MAAVQLPKVASPTASLALLDEDDTPEQVDDDDSDHDSDCQLLSCFHLSCPCDDCKAARLALGIAEPQPEASAQEATEMVVSSQSSVAVPSPIAGMQKVDTLLPSSQKPWRSLSKAVRKRIIKKTSVSSLVPQQQKTSVSSLVPQRRGLLKYIKHPRVMHTSWANPVVLPVKVVVRQQRDHRHAEAYMQQNTKKNSYLGGVTAARSPRYEEIVRLAASMFNKGELSTPAEGREWLGQQI